jgi:exodeoxyribonuclease VII small subunit
LIQLTKEGLSGLHRGLFAQQMGSGLGCAEERVFMDNQADPATLTFEQAAAELERIVQHLERGDVALEDSIRMYERGAALKAQCEAKLKDAQLKVEQIVLSADGPRLEPARLDR